MDRDVFQYVEGIPEMPTQRFAQSTGGAQAASPAEPASMLQCSKHLGKL
jgi:hypothetical protein